MRSFVHSIRSILHVLLLITFFASAAVAQEPVEKIKKEPTPGKNDISPAPAKSAAVPTGLTDQMRPTLESIYVIARQRTVQQDAGFGIRQIVDVALKALSPGVNDTTTAVMCVDYLRSVLCRLAERKISTAHRMEDGELRVIAKGPSFESLLAESYNQIRQNASGNVAILRRILHSLETITTRTMNPGRRRVLPQQADLVVAAAERTIPSTHDLAGVKAAMEQLSHRLNS